MSKTRRDKDRYDTFRVWDLRPTWKWGRENRDSEEWITFERELRKVQSHSNRYYTMYRRCHRETGFFKTEKYRIIEKIVDTEMNNEINDWLANH